MISSHQIRGARSMLGLSQAELSKLSGISLPRVIAFEQGRDVLQSTASAIIGALQNRGARFGADGGVRIAPPGEKFIVEPNQHPTPEQVRLAQAIVAVVARSPGDRRLPRRSRTKNFTRGDTATPSSAQPRSSYWQADAAAEK